MTVNNLTIFIVIIIIWNSIRFVYVIAWPRVFRLLKVSGVSKSVCIEVEEGVLNIN